MASVSGVNNESMGICEGLKFTHLSGAFRDVLVVENGCSRKGPAFRGIAVFDALKLYETLGSLSALLPAVMLPNLQGEQVGTLGKIYRSLLSSSIPTQAVLAFGDTIYLPWLGMQLINCCVLGGIEMRDSSLPSLPPCRILLLADNLSSLEKRHVRAYTPGQLVLVKCPEGSQASAFPVKKLKFSSISLRLSTIKITRANAAKAFRLGWTTMPCVP